MNAARNTRKETRMTPEHKKALAEGRALGRKVRGYVNAVVESKPKRGRKRTPESIERRLAAIEAELEDAPGLKQVELTQERMDLQTELKKLNEAVDLAALEADFVEAAAEYSDRKGISYAAWREVGISADVLKRAGISR